MKYCPTCGSEFFDDVSLCAECNERLVGEQEWKKITAEREMEDREVFVKVKTVDDEFEADVVKDALEKEQIPCLLRNFRDTSFDGIFMPQKGWGVIMVPEEYKEKAVHIIEEVESAE